jgi:hypothetical protein
VNLSKTAAELLRRWSRCTWVDGPVLEVPRGREADALELSEHGLVRGTVIDSDGFTPLTPDGIVRARELRLQAMGKADQ